MLAKTTQKAVHMFNRTYTSSYAAILLCGEHEVFASGVEMCCRLIDAVKMLFFICLAKCTVCISHMLFRISVEWIIFA